MRLYYIEYFVLQYVFQKSPQRGWGLLGKAPGNASPFFHIAAGRFRSPSHVLNARNGGRPFPLTIYGEGVTDRPGVRSWAQ